MSGNIIDKCSRGRCAKVADKWISYQGELYVYCKTCRLEATIVDFDVGVIAIICGKHISRKEAEIFVILNS